MTLTVLLSAIKHQEKNQLRTITQRLKCSDDWFQAGKNVVLFVFSAVLHIVLFDSAVMTDEDKVEQDSHFAMFYAIAVKSLIIRAWLNNYKI